LRRRPRAANVAHLGRYFAARGLRLNVLIELGVAGGRCGCRDREQVLTLAARIHDESALVLAGLEGYEGVVKADDGEPAAAIRAYAWHMVEAARALEHADLIKAETALITASGSAWYDLIAEVFHEASLGARFVPVLRPGCYVVHDHGIYREAQRGMLKRQPTIKQGLLPALEVFAQVQSLPEPGLAVVAMGKRDIGADQLPEPLRRYREGGRAEQTLSVAGWEVVKLMDQHAFVRLPAAAVGNGGDEVRIGDIIAFGASHPCLTFDKWRRVCRVDAALTVIEEMPTCF